MSAALSNDEAAYFPESNGTGWFVGIIVALALLAIGYLVFSANSDESTTRLLSSHVKIETERGHGSATHIGNGYFITAAHVVAEAKTADIVRVGPDLEAEVLWANADYDVALLKAPGDQFAFTRLICTTPGVGTVGTSYGNPLSLNDIQTTMRVAGAARSIGPWKLAIPTDGAIGPGMSGGAFIIDGELAGINVGAMMAPTSVGLPSYYGVSVIVPSSVICDLLGRS